MNLADLRNLGIIASLDADAGLLLDAPKGVLNDDLVERIRKSKLGLIAEIRYTPLAVSGDPALTPVLTAVPNETAARTAPSSKTFVIALPGRKPFGVTCPQGEKAVRAQWPTASSIHPA